MNRLFIIFIFSILFSQISNDDQILSIIQNNQKIMTAKDTEIEKQFSHNVKDLEIES